MNHFAIAECSNLLATSTALRESNSADMTIGYAIVADTPDYVPPKQGKKDGSHAELEKLRAQIIEEIGDCPKVTILARRRAVAIAFPQGIDVPWTNIPWTTLEAAKNPEGLDFARAELPSGAILTREFVRSALKTTRAERRVEKIREAEQEIAHADKVTASHLTTKQDFKRATKTREKALAKIEELRAPPAPRAPRLKTLITTSIKATEMAAKAEGDLHDHVETMSMLERQELAQKWSDAADACAAVVRILTDEVVEVEAAA